MGNISYEPPFKYLFSGKCTRHECCGYCDKCQVPYMETGAYEWDEQTGTYTFRFDEKGAEMKQINENDVCLYDGILLIVADRSDTVGSVVRAEFRRSYESAANSVQQERQMGQIGVNIAEQIAYKMKNNLTMTREELQIGLKEGK